MFLNSDEKLGIKIQKMTIQDLEEVTRIDSNFPSAWTYSAFEQSLKIQNECYILIQSRSKKIVGFFIGAPTDLEYNIYNFAIHPEHHRKGYGTFFLRRIINNHFKKYHDYYLEVRKSNTPAIELYFKIGFKVVSIRKEFYNDPVEDAFLMKYSPILERLDLQ